MTPANRARATILAAVKTEGRDAILGKIVQWNNTDDNDIDDDGDVWVSNPQTGHWISEDRLIEFATFLRGE